MDKLVFIHNFVKTEKDDYKSVHGCDVCSYGSKSAFFMLNHIKRHHLPTQLFDCTKSNVELYHCRNCNISFDNIIDLRRHIRKVHFLEEGEKVTYFTCETCSFQTSSCLDYFRHATKGCSADTIQTSLPETVEHLKIPEQNQTKSTDDENTWFKCDKCAFKTVNKSELNSHICKQTFKCDDCDFVTKYKSCLERHKIVKHCDKYKKWFFSDRCTYETRKKGDWKNLLVRNDCSIDGRIWNYCEKCDYKSIYKACVERHARKHSEDGADVKWIQCQHCIYKTKTRSDLYDHCLKEHPDKNKCVQCHKYTCECKLVPQKHVAKNSDVKWIKCQHCVYKTKTKSNLYEHCLKKHADKKRKCVRCYKYTLNCECKYLPQKHIDIKWIKCQHCKYKTKTRSDLYDHWLKEHAQKNKCVQCHKYMLNCECKYVLQKHIVPTKELSNKPFNPKDLLNKPLFYCVKCTYSSIHKKSIEIHFAACHSDNDKQWFQCSKCTYKSNIKEHFEAYYNEDKTKWLFNCNKCVYKSTLNDEDRWLRCDKCSYKTCIKLRLTKHINAKHSDKQWFQCDKCTLFGSFCRNDLRIHNLSKHRKKKKNY